MNSWRPYPLIRLIFPFLTGIIIEIVAGIGRIPFFFILAPLCCLLILNRVFLLTVSGYGYRWISGLLINLFLILAGFGISSIHRPSFDCDFLGYCPDGLFMATIAEPPGNNGHVIKAMLDARYRRDHGRWVRASGKALGYLQVLPGAKPLQYGDFILLHAGFSEITDNSNPHSFNYTAYLKNMGVTHRCYARVHDWAPVHLPPMGIVKRVAFQFRDRLLNMLRSNQVKGKEFAVASALLLGYVGEIDAGLRKDYAASGAMHILSVSGMHVGIIYLFLEFLLGFLNRNRAGRFVKAVTLLVFIWFYALLTGLSPCVLRSAAMLSLPILGKSLNRSPKMFNILAASVFFILAMDPLLIRDVSFQLSYLAVTSIVILYKPIYDLYVTSAWLPDKIWSILACSIAAQLGTLPITLFTFHQFPNYFMVTNIFVIPLSSLVIYVGIFALAAGAIPVISILSAKVLIFLVWLLNSIIHFVEQLPCSTTRGIFISTTEMLFLYLVIAAGFLFLTRKHTVWLWIFLVVALTMNISAVHKKLDRLGASRFVVFNSPHAALYEFTHQDRAVIFYNTRSAMDAWTGNMNRDIVQADLDAHGIRISREYWLGRAHPGSQGEGRIIPLIRFGNFFQSGFHRVALLARPIPKGFRGRLHVEYLILSGNPAVSVFDAVKFYHPRQIIIDATVSRLRTEQWLRESEKLRVPCHAVTINGAFEKEF